MEYSSYWRGWMKSNQIFYFCFAAPSLLARLRYAGHKMVGSCREILLRRNPFAENQQLELLESFILTTEKEDLLAMYESRREGGGTEGQGTSVKGQIGGFQYKRCYPL
jgi:hypothetical protein